MVKHSLELNCNSYHKTNTLLFCQPKMNLNSILVTLTTHKINSHGRNGHRKKKSLEFKKNYNYRPPKLETIKLINCFICCHVKH